MNIKPCVGRVPGPGARRFLAANEPATARTATNGTERPNHIATDVATL